MARKSGYDVSVRKRGGGRVQSTKAAYDKNTVNRSPNLQQLPAMVVVVLIMTL